MRGGTITYSTELEKIVSIGYEIESGMIAPFIITEDDSIISLSSFTYAKKIRGLLLSEKPNQSFMLTPDATTGGKTPIYALHFFMGDRRPEPITISNDYGKIILDAMPDDTEDYLDNTEFHYTFKNILPSKNIIVNTLTEVLDTLQKYFTPSRENRIQYKTGIISSKGESFGVCTYVIVGNILYLIPGNIIHNMFATLPWTLQVTIGVRLENVPDVLNYISKDSGFTALIAPVNTHLAELNKIVKQSPASNGFLFLLLLNITPKDITDKKYYYYPLRHTLFTIYSAMSPIDKENITKLFDENYDSLSSMGANQYGSVYDLFDLFLFGDKNDPNHFTGTKKLPYSDGIVLIEVRDFQKQLKRLLGDVPPTLANIKEKFDLIKQQNLNSGRY